MRENLLLLLAIAMVLSLVIPPIYRMKDHVRYDNLNSLSATAKIASVNHKRVGLAKQGTARYCTTVVFDDGFTFISYKTNVKTHFGSYTISLEEKDKIEILYKAKQAHTKALQKKNVHEK